MKQFLHKLSYIQQHLTAKCLTASKTKVIKKWHQQVIFEDSIQMLHGNNDKHASL